MYTFDEVLPYLTREMWFYFYPKTYYEKRRFYELIYGAEGTFIKTTRYGYDLFRTYCPVCGEPMREKLEYDPAFQKNILVSSTCSYCRVGRHPGYNTAPFSIRA